VLLVLQDYTGSECSISKSTMLPFRILFFSLLPANHDYWKETKAALIEKE
jgi:hypothetical protein